MTYVIAQLVWERSPTQTRRPKDARRPPMITRRQALDVEVSPPQRQDLAGRAVHHIHTSSQPPRPQAGIGLVPHRPSGTVEESRRCC